MSIEKTHCRVLLVDDEESVRKLIRRQLEDEGAEVVDVDNGKDACAAIDSSYFDLVLTDLWLPEVDGLKIIEHAHGHDPELPIIVMTGFGTTATAVQAMRMGATDYMEKPVTRHGLQMALAKASRVRRLVRENRLLRESIEELYDFRNMVGESRAFLEALKLAGEVSKSDATVLLTGESGTGKELVARAIHYNSARATKPFVPINCAAIPETLLESELFGHEKGAFTGAHRTQAGRFETANGGTVFMDEISEMSPSLQVKLLRVLQEQKFQRVGGTRQITVDVRLISASNRPLEKLVKTGEFRDDLYYRINVFPIDLPPLRERPEDIMPLARNFLRQFAAEMGKNVTAFSPEAERLLRGHSWPGNVRELQNVVERATILCSGDAITSADLPWPHQLVSSTPEPETGRMVFMLPPQGISLDRLEGSMLRQALEAAKGNKSKAARLLGLSRAKLRYRLRKHGIDE